MYLPELSQGPHYSDEMMIDVALTKYCDLIPIERYAAIAARAGLMRFTASEFNLNQATTWLIF